MKDPLAFSSALDTVCADAESMTESLTLTIRDGNQFWFVLPDGILPNNPDADVSIPYMRFTAEGRRSNMLARMTFMRENGVVKDEATGKRLLIEFRPCILVGRSKEGHALVQQVEDLEGPAKPEGARAEKAKPEPPKPPPEPEGTKIPDIGELLAGLQQTRKSLETIDTLLEAPDALLEEDEGKRKALQDTIAATKDKALIGLGQLGDVLTRGGEQSLEEWREGVSKALAATIEAMVSFDDMAEHLREGKRREMETLRQSIEAYFATIDPKVDFEACRKFSTGVNQLILEERQETLELKRGRLEKNIERGYDYIIASMQQMLGKGASMPLIPHPSTEPAEGYMAKFVFNMVHIVMAVRYGGLSIALDTERYPRLYGELKGWNETRPPRVHIVDRRRNEAIKAGKKIATFD
ncbi:MAG: hypothetical protein WCO00_06805 [Rhodospirillaceae bacterium]